MEEGPSWVWTYGPGLEVSMERSSGEERCMLEAACIKQFKSQL